VTNLDTWSWGENIFALKVQSPPCIWEYYIAYQLEQRIPLTLKPKFPKIYSQHVYQKASYLLMEYSDQGTLQDLINASKVNGRKIDEPVIIFYTIEMLSILEAMHNSGIIHGDIKPDNLLILDLENTVDLPDWRPGMPEWASVGLKVIDFGRSIDTKLYPEGTLFFGDCHADAFRCVEMETNRPWTYQIDIFGICAVVHCLLHDSYMDIVQDPKTERWRAKEPFKRYWQTDLWEELFDTMLNIPDCNSIPSLSVYRTKLENHLLKDPAKMKSIKHSLARQNILLFEYQKNLESK